MPGRPTATSIMMLAIAAGGIVGVGSAMTAREGRATVAASVRKIAVGTGIRRARQPRPGDHWGGCDDARAAGTAPIYRGEPGYRTDMDGDGDGVACEPRP